MAKNKTIKPKPKAKKPKSGSRASAPHASGKVAGAVRVRMYCQGLGDCFLITFPRKSGKGEFHLLIDCGLIIGTPSASDRMKQVIDDIAATTGGTIDVLVGTHEHWDHVSGFVEPKDQFSSRLKVERTWLAWTENPKDPLAKRLRKEREDKKQKLALALDHFQRIGLHENVGSQRAFTQLAGLTSFFGVDAGSAALSAAAGMGKTAQAMKYLSGQNPEFLVPGEKPPKIDVPDGIDIFVLGPPTDEKLLKKDLPTKKGKEVYEEHSSHSLVGLDVPDDSGRQENQPFENRLGMPLAAAASDPYFSQMYDNGLDDHPSAWRRIDDIGMFAATDLALQLDADTNNTSLVLAIRLPNGKVLLFPGDAQVGNWESWHQIKMHDGKTTMAQLLADTVVYKVGHHGSHNATLSKLGLDMMSSTELLALLPVDEEVAHDKKGWLKMPFEPLMNELRKKTAGRIMRADYERKHKATDVPAAGIAGKWRASAATFDTEPKRSLYLETFVKLK